MTFDEILPVVKAGGKAQRAIWASRYGPDAALELVHSPELADGRRVMPVLVIGYGDSGVLRPFTGANWDLLADDWEIVS
jgi:uncharacterized protein DUF2829